MVTRITRLVVVAEVIKSIRAISGGVDLTLTTLDNNRGGDLGTGAAAAVIIRVVSVRTRTKAEEEEDTPTTRRGKEAKHFLTTSSTSRAAGRNVTPGV